MPGAILELPRWGGGKSRNQQRFFRVNTKHSALQRSPRLDVEAIKLAKTFQMPKDSCRPVAGEAGTQK